MKTIDGEPVHFDPGVVMGPEFLDCRDKYAEFIAAKSIQSRAHGLTVIPDLHPAMFPHQRDVTGWALRLGKAAAFLGTGLGKTLIELEWARVVAEHTGGAVLVLAPLAVARQTVREAEKFGMEIHYCREMKESTRGVNVTNYERLSKFDPTAFDGIVLDESSILKSFDGATRSALIESFRDTPYRLAATATPAPNDYMELGNHAEFLGVMTATEMLSTFFVHDGGETQKWRLKGHARKDFWKWVCTWAVSMNKPSDIGHSDEGFILPPLIYHEHILNVETPSEGMLFAMPAETLGERLGARRSSIKERVELTASIILDSWIPNRSDHTTASISDPIGSESTHSDGNDTLPTQNGRSPKSMHGEKPTSKSVENLSASTAMQTGIDCVPTCGIDTKTNAKNLSHMLARGRKRTATNIGIPIYGTSMALDSTTTTECSHPRTEDALFAEELIESHSPSITATPEAMLEGCCAQGVITDSEDSATIHPDSAEQPRILKTQWVAWCTLNDEQDMLSGLLGARATSIDGRTDSDAKVALLESWQDGANEVLVSKSKVFGFGLNLQMCSHMIFVGVTDSWESFYQSVRRVYRFGQTKPVHVHIIAASTEGNVLENLKRKEKEATHMAEEMVANMQDLTRMHLRGTVREQSVYERKVETSENWTIHLADCVDLAEELPGNSIHYSVFSPPFASLYTYSASERDMGNSRTHDEFWEHYKFLIKESYRVMMPGRLVSIHCMNLPTSKVRDGHIGIRDFRGEIIRAYEDVGFIYHSEVCIWKDPVTAMQRTKALGLLHKTIRKDSAMSRHGVPDYLVTMRKPGENPEAIAHTKDEFPVELWQNYASPVWMDINPSDTLQYRSAREHEDERHICPLQLEVIRRAVKLWSNPGDTVWSPFAGIGSEGFVALEMGRKFIGSELKPSYFRQAHKNLAAALSASTGLFASADDEPDPYESVIGVGSEDV